jgi:hypothetical protein
LSLLGESMSRAGTVSPYLGPWLATMFIVRFELAVSVCQSRAVHIFGVDLGHVDQKKRVWLPNQIRPKHRGFLALGFPEPDGCDAAFAR